MLERSKGMSCYLSTTICLYRTTWALYLLGARAILLLISDTLWVQCPNIDFPALQDSIVSCSFLFNFCPSRTRLRTSWTQTRYLLEWACSWLVCYIDRQGRTTNRSAASSSDIFSYHEFIVRCRKINLMPQYIDSFPSTMSYIQIWWTSSRLAVSFWLAIFPPNDSFLT
jgi:hypothetical protein